MELNSFYLEVSLRRGRRKTFLSRIIEEWIKEQFQHPLLKASSSRGYFLVGG